MNMNACIVMMCASPFGRVMANGSRRRYNCCIKRYYYRTKPEHNYTCMCPTQHTNPRNYSPTCNILQPASLTTATAGAVFFHR